MESRPVESELVEVVSVEKHKNIVSEPMTYE